MMIDNTETTESKYIILFGGKALLSDVIKISLTLIIGLGVIPLLLALYYK